MSDRTKHPRKIFLVEGFYDRGSHLFLYDGPVDKDRSMASFLERGLEKGEFCCHIYSGDTQFKLRRHLRNAEGKLVMVPMSRKKLTSLSAKVVKRLYKTLEELHRKAGKYRAARLQLDFGAALRNGSMEEILNLERWTHSWNFPNYATMSVFNMPLLRRRDAEELVKIHDIATLSTKEGTSVFFSKNSPPSITVVSERNMDGWIKKSLEVLVLSLVQQRPMCGIDIIKTISRSFGVEISQGVVYPILYSLIGCKTTI